MLSINKGEHSKRPTTNNEMNSDFVCANYFVISLFAMQSTLTSLNLSTGCIRYFALMFSFSPLFCFAKCMKIMRTMNWHFELMWYCRLSAWCVPMIGDFSFLCDILRHRPAPNSCTRQNQRCGLQCAAKHSRTAKLERVNDFVNNEKSNWLKKINWVAAALFALLDCPWTTFLRCFFSLFCTTRKMKCAFLKIHARIVQTTKRFEGE